MTNVSTYFTLQFKRLIKILPAILIASILTCLTAALIIFAGVKSGLSGDKTTSLKIGMVGEFSNYMGINFTEQLTEFARIANFDMEFTSCTEEEAKSKLISGELSTYIIIPDGFIESLATGRNDVKLYYASLDNKKSISVMLMDEIAQKGSSFITLAESSCFTLQYILMQMKDPQWAKKVDYYSVQQILIFVGMMRFWDTEVVGLGETISLAGYYTCAVITLFILLFGFNASLFFTKRERTLYQNLTLRKLNEFKMIASEFGAYTLFLFIFLTIIISACVILEKSGHFLSYQEWIDRGFFALATLYFQVFLAVLLIGSLQFMIFEIFDNYISQVIALFFVAFFMGFISGLFYPASIFPEWLQTIGALLPTGVAMSVIQSGFTGFFNSYAFIALILYTFLFLAISKIARKKKIYL